MGGRFSTICESLSRLCKECSHGILIRDGWVALFTFEEMIVQAAFMAEKIPPDLSASVVGF